MEKFKPYNNEGITPTENEGTSEKVTYPEFDIEAAMRQREEAMRQHEEEEPLSPEELKETGKMIEQLEKNGADPKITSNPAFKEMLEHYIFSYRLISAQHTEANQNGKTLNINYTGQTYNPNTTCGDMHLTVHEDGSVTMECATLESKPSYLSGDALKKYNGIKRDDGNIDSINITNSASITEFSIDKDGNLVSKEHRSHEIEHVPKERYNGEAIYSGNHSKTTRRFTEEGIENFREDVYYSSRSSDIDGLLAHTGMNYPTDKPKSATYNLLNNKFLQSDTVEERTSLERNPDGTIRVKNITRGVGEITIDKCPKRDGTNNLVPVSTVIADAKQNAKNNKSI